MVTVEENGVDIETLNTLIAKLFENDTNKRCNRTPRREEKMNEIFKVFLEEGRYLKDRYDANLTN